MSSFLEQVQEAAAFLRDKRREKPQVGLILGSGLGDLVQEVEEAVTIPFAGIPHFARSTVEGHAGTVVLGHLEGRPVMVLQGRLHAYEGWEMRQVVLPVYVMRQLGVELLLITNAAGGLNPDFQPGDLMVIRDHLNLTGHSPLAGENHPELGPRFPDLSQAYDARERELLLAVAAQEGIAVHEGVYAGILGPNYLTKAELRMLILMGADALGMSSVPEVMAAAHCGLKVAAISCITDMAIPEQLVPPTHEQVLQTAEKAKGSFQRLVKRYIQAAG